MSKKSKKKKTRDLLEVLFVFAVIILVAVAATTIGRDLVEIGSKSASTASKKNDTDNREEVVVIALTGVAVCVVICYAIKKSKEIKRRNEAIRIHNERLEERRRIEEAKERVRQAKMQGMVDAGKDRLTSKSSGRQYTSGVKEIPKWNRDDDLLAYDEENGKSRRYYDEDYDDIPDDDLLDDELLEDYEENDFLSKLKSNWWIILSIVVVIVCIVVFIFVL